MSCCLKWTRLLQSSDTLHTFLQADVLALVGVRASSNQESLSGYNFSKGEFNAVSFLQDVTASVQRQQRTKGLWHFTVSPALGMTSFTSSLTASSESARS